MSDSVSFLESLPRLWLPLSVILLFLGSIIVLADRLNSLNSTYRELTRKVVHIGTGNVILLAWWLDIPAWLGICAAVIAGIIALTSYFIPILPSIDSVGRRSLGTFFYAVSIGVLIACFWPLRQPQYAAIGILVMAWGDGLAGLMGQNFGQHPYQILGIRKSWEGSLTMMGVSFLVTSFVLFTVVGYGVQTWLTGLLVAILATILEIFSPLGVDNLTVPLASAGLAFFVVNA